VSNSSGEVIVRIRLGSGRDIELTADELRGLKEFTVGDLDFTVHILNRIKGCDVDWQDLPIQVTYWS